MNWIEIGVTVICAVIASSGFWAYLQRKYSQNDSFAKLVVGLAHDRIIFLSMGYIERGWITQDEYEDLNKYLYNPYRDMGGNGTAERLMTEIKKLPIHHISYAQQAKENSSGESVQCG